jgi:hypothetical protein
MAGDQQQARERAHHQALELARAGRWDEAHELAQSHDDALSCLIHGYLHRVEGDLGNATYWYRRGGEALPDNDLADEAARLQALAEAAAGRTP